MRRPLRVALMSTVVEFGGIERVLLNLLEHHTAKVDIRALLFTRTDTKDLSFFERLDAMGIAHDTFYVNTNRRLILNPMRNLRESAAIFRRHRFDVIHSHGYRADMLALPLAKYFGLPVVSTVHGFIPATERLRRYERIDLRILRYFTRVIAVSDPMRTQLAATGIPGDKIDVLPNAVPVPHNGAGETRTDVRRRLGLADGEFVFGYVGRLSDEKGVEYLLRAFDHLVSTNGASRLLVVGDGPSRAALERAARERNLGGRVVFTGFQRNPAPMYAAMDAFVLPSLTEGTPMALLEAMAHRLPVIASAVGGVPGVVTDRANGLLVPAGDQTPLADAMSAVAHDPELRCRLSTGALRVVQERYDVRQWTREVEAVYERALGHRGAQA